MYWRAWLKDGPDDGSGRLAHRPTCQCCTDAGSLSPRFRRRQNVYFCTKLYDDYRHTQTNTWHIRLIKCKWKRTESEPLFRRRARRRVGESGLSVQWQAVTSHFAPMSTYPTNSPQIGRVTARTSVVRYRLDLDNNCQSPDGYFDNGILVIPRYLYDDTSIAKVTTYRGIS